LRTKNVEDVACQILFKVNVVEISNCLAVLLYKLVILYSRDVTSFYQELEIITTKVVKEDLFSAHVPNAQFYLKQP
jgi:hypothetical protein